MISIVRRQNICRMSGTSWIGHAMARDAELNGDLFTISTVEAHDGALFPLNKARLSGYGVQPSP